MKSPLLCLLCLCATLIKLVFHSSLSKWFRLFPHFQTPLTDLREVREMLFQYEFGGEFYSNSMQIGQSELLLKCVYFLQKHFVRVEHQLIAADWLLTLSRLLLVEQICPKNQRTFMYGFVLLNPLTIFG